MKKINFIFGVHNHQPVGNYDSVFKWATESAYQPFLEVIEKYDDVKIVFHYTGCLIDYLDVNMPGVIQKVKNLVKSGRAEVLTGGYYEPIMPVIPDRDKTGQIKKLTSYVTKTFSCKPKGMWLAERVWEPSLAKVLSESGVEYVVLDDSHFLASGINEEKLRGYFITEEQGVSLKIFPISQKLRYIIPFASPEETIEYLAKEASEDPSRLLVMADDGEKFGIWPETHKTCYAENWLDRFFSLIQKNSSWINMTTFESYVKDFSARGRIYLPAASYFEMSEWSLPSEVQVEFEKMSLNSDAALKRFLKGGIWRNFLTKYPESNNMHKKMLYISDKIETLSLKNVKNKKILADSKKHLYMGQCNCAYWHGVFGGLYLPHLRHAVYKNLIEAECIAQSAAPSSLPDVEIFDIDRDGEEEVVFSGEKISFCAKPSYGGMITEIDYKPALFNLSDVLTRRFEAYHTRVKKAVIKKENHKLEVIHGVYYTKELGLENYLKYDWYNRGSAIDHFFGTDTTLEKYSCCEYRELGDFVNQPYKLSAATKKPAKNGIRLFRDGCLWTDNGIIPVTVVKRIEIINNKMILKYEIINNSAGEYEFWHGSEFNISFSSPCGDGCCLSSGDNKIKFGELGEFRNCNLLEAIDPFHRLKLSFTAVGDSSFWFFPLWTVSLSEGGFEKTYQGSSITAHRKVFLAPKQKYAFEIALSIDCE